ncbi:MAG: aldose 1-epimerase family protein [Chloroflexota bacterium]|nr:aldose 1-epimerase family protein [Chloroflexota bacterium]
MLDKRTWAREMLERHSTDLRQFIGFKQSTLVNGMRVIEAYNVTGLRYTILPDRGMDIWMADYRGIPLTWVAQGSPFPPDYGQPWLGQFSGGLLTTCGLTHSGPPEHDDETGAFRDLHGLYTRQRALEPSISGGWEDDDYVLRLTASVAEGALHGYQLRLVRTYELSLTAPEIRVHDTITNIGDQPTPLMVLYHLNVGYPMVKQGTRLELAGKNVPRDEEARKGAERWAEYDAAIRGYAEQVYFHHVHVNSDETEVALISDDDLALGFRYNAAKLPYLTQWKNQRHGMYVHGIEPANCLPEGRNAARKTGRLQYIEPDQVIDFGRITMTVYTDEQAVGALKGRIASLRSDGEPVQGCKLP